MEEDPLMLGSIAGSSWREGLSEQEELITVYLLLSSPIWQEYYVSRPFLLLLLFHFFLNPERSYREQRDEGRKHRTHCT